MEKDTFVTEWLSLLENERGEIDVLVVDTGELLRVPRINCVLDAQVDRSYDEVILDRNTG